MTLAGTSLASLQRASPEQMAMTPHDPTIAARDPRRDAPMIGLSKMGHDVSRLGHVVPPGLDRHRPGSQRRPDGPVRQLDV